MEGRELADKNIGYVKKRIKEKTVCSFYFKLQIDSFLADNNIEVRDVISITTNGDCTTLWYWG